MLSPRGQSSRLQDRDLFLPLDPDNLLSAWLACEAAGLELWMGDEPLGAPMDRLLAERIVANRALVRAISGTLQVDLTLMMAGFDFEETWAERRSFPVEGVDIPVARLVKPAATPNGSVLIGLTVRQSFAGRAP